MISTIKDIMTSPTESEHRYAEIATQTDKIVKEDCSTQTEDDFMETTVITYPEAAAKEEFIFTEPIAFKGHLEVVMEEESEFAIVDEPVCKEFANEKEMDTQTSPTVFSEVVIIENNKLQEKEVFRAECMEVSELLDMVVDQVTNGLEMKNTESAQGYATKQSIVGDLETCYKEETGLHKDVSAEEASRKLPENTTLKMVVDCAPAVHEAGLESTDDTPVKMSAEAIVCELWFKGNTEETETVHVVPEESETEPKRTTPEFATIYKMFSTEEARDGSMLETEADHTTLRVVMTDSNGSLENLPVIHMMDNISDILHEIPEPTKTQEVSARETLNTENKHLNAERETAIDALCQQFQRFVTAEPSVEENASCLQVETLRAIHGMPLFDVYEHCAIFAGESLHDNDISPKEESVAEKILEAAIDAMSNELIMVTESSDEQSSTYKPPGVLLAGLIQSSLQDLEKVQQEDVSLDCIEPRFYLKDRICGSCISETIEATDQIPAIPEKSPQDNVNILDNEPNPEVVQVIIDKNQENVTQEILHVDQDSKIVHKYLTSTADSTSPTDEKTLDLSVNPVGEESSTPKGFTEHVVTDCGTEEIHVSADAAETKYTHVTLGDPVMEIGVHMEPHVGAQRGIGLNIGISFTLEY